VAERSAHGKSLRKETPRSSHGEWVPAKDRRDPVTLLEEQNADRIPWLVPVRRGRMVASPFTFYRGAARIMAADLASTPVSGLTVQACGDAHLSNFGVYASPERRLVFDVNDFDETLPGPWEWDLKRLATSFIIAGQHRGFDAKTCRVMAQASVRGYREAMAKFAGMLTLDTWYAHLDIEGLQDLVAAQETKKQRGKVQAGVKKVHSRDSLQELSKLAVEVDGQYRIKSDPPVLLPLSELPGDHDPDTLTEQLWAGFDQYRSSLDDAHRHLLDRFRPVEAAIKVVGVGSAGTRCLILLLEGRDTDDPLFLQFKEATTSVLAEFLEPSVYANEGQRVVEGQRFTQAVSDSFLGWAHIGTHDFYWRQLRDGKASADIDRGDPVQLRKYARLCGWTLAHAHARTGDAVAIAGYLGSNDVFDKALTRFAERYAKQNLQDYQAFKGEIEAGRLAADTTH
jgi:uncharacterized protein (DUF2252 family)